VPLLVEEARVSPALKAMYLDSFNLGSQFNFLPFIHDSSERDTRVPLEDMLDFRMSQVVVPVDDDAECTLEGYTLQPGFGLGDNEFGTLVYDAPLHIGVYNGEYDSQSGVLGIGLWVNNANSALLAQIQPMRGKRLPEGVLKGDVAIAIAEKVVAAMGIPRMIHPQFLMYPESRGRMQGDFERDFDRSARWAGYCQVPPDTSQPAIGYEKSF
ncbi:MAG: hypothetical protein ACOCWQ_01125, partial [Nanoarchaeota archaeon]